MQTVFLLTESKHIVPEEALSGTCIAVGIEEAAERWIVISALQVVEARLRNCVLPLRAI